jgi:hypothetical protein
MNKRRITALAIILTFLANTTSAQECDSKLEEANRAYYNGEFQKVMDLLLPCADEISSREGRIEAYTLLSQASIMMEEDSLAQTMAFNTLKQNPFYKPRQGTLKAYQDMHDGFEIRNYLNLGFSAGLNHSSFSILDYHSYASISEEPASYQTFTGFNFNLWASYFLIYDFYFKAGLGFQQHEFYQQEIIFNYQLVSSRETYQYLSIPLQLEYQFSKWKLKPFVNGGVSYHTLSSAQADITNSPIEGGIPNPFAGVTRSVEDYDISHQRTSGHWNLLVGGGLRYQVQHFSIEASIYYENGENNLVEESVRYQNSELISQYSYVPDDFKLRQLSFNLGIVYSFLKPVRAK